MNKAGNILQLLANSKPMIVLVIPPRHYLATYLLFRFLFLMLIMN